MPLGIENLLNEQLDSEKDTSKKLRLKNNVEEIIIKWATQINEILNTEFSKLSKSEQELPTSGNLIDSITFNIYHIDKQVTFCIFVSYPLFLRIVTEVPKTVFMMFHEYCFQYITSME